jgi:SAM-dependent methyltransferase
LLPDHEGALDVGASDGAFLEELLELGFRDVKGIEPSEASVTSAKMHIRPLISNTFFNINAFMPQSQSLISCLQTIEHIENPREFFNSAFHLLQPQGALFVVAHNYRSFSARILRNRSPIFDIEHYQLFSEKSIYELFDRSGFKRVRVFPIFNTYPVRYWFKLLPISLDVKKRFIGFLQRLKIADIELTMPAGNLAAIGFK